MKSANYSPKKIAVITPVFNGEEFLAECIKSVDLSISGRKFVIEHIIVDDCSTDNSWKIIQETKSARIRPFHLDKNSGSSAARNYGVKQTDADFIFCLDQDDVILQNSLKTLFEYSEKLKADWIYGDFLRADNNLSYLFGQDYYGYQFGSSNDLLSSIFLGKHFFQQNCFYRKQIFDAVKGFDNNIKIYQDLDLFIRFALTGRNPKYLSAPLYLHRLHENNFSKISGRENNFDAHKEDLKTLYKKYAKPLKNILTPQQLRKIQNFLNVP